MATGIFNKPAYDTASNKALVFIKTQMRLTSASSQLPVSYRVPANDSKYGSDKDRCYIYDTGLALLAFTTSGDYDLCERIMQQLSLLPKSNGGFYNGYYFSNNKNTWKKIDEKVYTGSMGWLVWGMCYYSLVRGITSYNTMINAAGKWLLDRQVPPNDSLQRTGLLKGGFAYNDAEVLTELDYCSTEHQCSALQALQGLAARIPNNGYSKSYANAASEVKNWLNPNQNANLTLYDSTVGSERYKRGVRDPNFWALDCSTWAGATANNLLTNGSDIANACRATAGKAATPVNYLVTGETITDPNSFYSSNSGVVKGFKPKKDTTHGYSDAINLVWTEGTLGYVLLCMLRNHADATTYMDEIIKLQNCTGSIGGLIYATKVGAGEDWDSNVWESVTSSAWLYLLITNPDILFMNLSNTSSLPKYRVTFNINWVNGIDPHKQMVPSDGKAIAPQTPYRQNYTFVEWNDKIDGTGNAIDLATYTFSSDKILYAIWVIPPGFDFKMINNSNYDFESINVILKGKIGSASGSEYFIDKDPESLYAGGSLGPYSGFNIIGTPGTTISNIQLVLTLRVFTSAYIHVNASIDASGPYGSKYQTLQSGYNANVIEINLNPNTTVPGSSTRRMLTITIS